MTHFLNLSCNYPEYHILYDDTHDHFQYLVQESAIIFVSNWIKLNAKFVKKETPMPNAPIILTLLMSKIHLFTTYYDNKN